MPSFKYKYWTTYPKFFGTKGEPHSRPLLLYLLAKKQYYTGSPIMSDGTFDTFELAIKKRFHECPILTVVGEPQEKDVRNLGKWCSQKRTEILCKQD